MPILRNFSKTPILFISASPHTHHTLIKPAASPLQRARNDISSGFESCFCRFQNSKLRAEFSPQFVKKLYISSERGTMVTSTTLFALYFRANKAIRFAVAQNFDFYIMEATLSSH